MTLSETPNASEALQQAAQDVVVNIGGGDAANNDDVTYADPRQTMDVYVLPKGNEHHIQDLINLITVGGREYRQTNAAWQDLRKYVAALYPKINLDFGFTVAADGKIIITNGNASLTSDQKRP